MQRQKMAPKSLVKNHLMMLYVAKSFSAESETLCFRLLMTITLIAELSMLGWNGQFLSIVQMLFTVVCVEGFAICL